MALSEAQRQALRDRARGLRAEVSALTGQRDDAYREASQVRNDAKLAAEVVALEEQRAAAIAAKERAEGSVEDAAAIMEAAIRQHDVVSDADPTGSSPATAATDNTTPDAYIKSVGHKTEEAPAVEAAPSNTKGGKR